MAAVSGIHLFHRAFHHCQSPESVAASKTQIEAGREAMDKVWMDEGVGADAKGPEGQGGRHWT